MFNFIGAIAIITSTVLVQIPSPEPITSVYHMTSQEQVIHEEMALKNTNRYNSEEE